MCPGARTNAHIAIADLASASGDEAHNPVQNNYLHMSEASSCTCRHPHTSSSSATRQAVQPTGPSLSHQYGASTHLRRTNTTVSASRRGHVRQVKVEHAGHNSGKWMQRQKVPRRVHQQSMVSIDASAHSLLPQSSSGWLSTLLTCALLICWSNRR